MLEAGIAERRTQVVNWDPVDQTVLANEQVIDGRGWRSGALVEKREIPGYYLKITQYADELLDCVQTGLPGWPERVKLMQEHWLGKSEGVRFAFPHDIRDADGALIGGGRLYVFTTRADTIMGVTFCAVAPEHPLALRAAAAEPGGRGLPRVVQDRRHDRGRDGDAGQAAASHTGLFVEHPLSHEQIPLWVGNYVLMQLRRRRRDGRAGATTSATSRSPSSTASTCCRSSTSTARHFSYDALAGLVRRHDSAA